MKRYGKSYRTVKKRSIFSIFKYKITWVVLLVLVFVVGLTYLFVFSSVFQIKNINISRTEKVSTEEIHNIISNNVNNIFLANLKEISQEITDKFPQIASITIKKKLPNELIADIVERQPIAILCDSNNSCYYIDNKGVLFEEAGDKDLPIIKTEGSLYNLKLGEEALDKDYLEKLLTINYNVKDIEIAEIYPVSENRLDIKTTENWNIYFNMKEDIDWQIEKLNILLKEKLPIEERTNLEYIDLRFEKIYIYPENR